MKSLKSLNFGANEMLLRNEMKTILGGEGDTLTQSGPGGGGPGFEGPCTVLCANDERVSSDSCATSNANTACTGKGGPRSCAGPGGVCG